MIRQSILLIAAYFLLLDATSQSSFQNGYVVNLNGDTTHLQIKDKFLGKKSFLKVRVNGKSRKLPLDEVGYFQIYGYELYKVDSAKAYNVLLQGDISLYIYDRSFWVEKDSHKVRLKTAVRSMDIGGITKEMEVAVWRNEIGKLTGECTKIDPDSKLHKRDLIEILSHYHDCAGKPYRVIENGKMSFKAQIQGGPEVTQSVIRVQKREQPDEAISVLAIPEGPNTFLAETYHSSDLFFNSNISVFIDRKHQFAFETGLNIGSADFSATEKGILANQLYHSALSYKIVTIPLSLRYENQIGKLILFGAGGMTYSTISDATSKIFIDSDTNFGRVVNTPGKPLLLDSSLIGLLFQAGAKFNFHDFFAGLSGKYYTQVGFNEIDTLDANYVRLSLELFLGYSLNLSK